MPLANLTKGKSKDTCLTHGYGQQCDDGLREVGGRGWVEVGKGGKVGTTVIV